MLSTLKLYSKSLDKKNNNNNNIHLGLTDIDLIFLEAINILCSTCVNI